MRWIKWLGVVSVLAACAGAGSVSATAVNVTVADAGGVLVDAVVSLEPARPAPPAAAKTAEMDQVNSQFVPAVLAVRTGTLVRFPNNDQIRHQVYSFSPAKRFELPLFQGTTATSVRFDQAGLVTIGCNIHDWMLGYIVVLDKPYFGQTGSDGRAQLEAAAGNYTEWGWHPRSKGGGSSEPWGGAGQPGK
ncbi:methylamine utilization protein, partial [Xanthomonas perforans]